MYNIEDLTEQARRSGRFRHPPGMRPAAEIPSGWPVGEHGRGTSFRKKTAICFCQDLAKDAMYEKLEYTGELDFSREIRGIRCRCHVFKQQGKVSAAIRLLSESIPRLDPWDFPICAGIHQPPQGNRPGNR